MGVRVYVSTGGASHVCILQGGTEAGTENFSEQTSSSVTAMGEQSCGHGGWTVGLCGMQDVPILGRQLLGVSAGCWGGITPCHT